MEGREGEEFRYRIGSPEKEEEEEKSTRTSGASYPTFSPLTPSDPPCCEIVEVPSHRLHPRDRRSLSSSTTCSHSEYADAVKATSKQHSSLFTFLWTGFGKKKREEGGTHHEASPKGMVTWSNNDINEESILESAEGEEHNHDLVFLEDDGSSAVWFDLEDLLRGSAMVMGDGDLATAYKVRLDSGDEVVVRRLKNQKNCPKSEFERQVRLLHGLRHPNIISPFAFYYGERDRLVIYQGLTWGSIGRRLHLHDGENPDWNMRSNWISDVAHAIAYVHSQPAAPHVCLKSSHITLDEDNRAHVCGVGIYLLVDLCSSHGHHRTYCYAPRVLHESSHRLAREDDVYAFGIFTLEMLTGKDLYWFDDNEVAEFVEWLRRAADANDDGKVFDPRLPPSTDVELLRRMLHLGLECVRQQRDDRPSMKEVLEIIGANVVDQYQDCSTAPLVEVGKDHTGVPSSEATINTTDEEVCSADQQGNHSPSSTCTSAEPSTTTLPEGEPKVLFPRDEILRSVIPFQYSLVSKCSYGYPPVAFVKDFFSSHFRLSKDFYVRNLDRRHLLFRFQDEEDFVKVLEKGRINVEGFVFDLFKWTPTFHLDQEATIRAVWFLLPGLPPNFFTETMLERIVEPIGRLVRTDLVTRYCTKLDAARVCLEMDTSRELPRRVWIGCDDGSCSFTGFWQTIQPEMNTLYCSQCLSYDHVASECMGDRPDGGSKEHKTVGY